MNHETRYKLLLRWLNMFHLLPGTPLTKSPSRIVSCIISSLDAVEVIQNIVNTSPPSRSYLDR
jgi:hypothetical protein